MMTRPLGKTGFSIAPLVFGGNVFGWTIDEKTSFAILDAFIDHGFDAIDTADVYSRWADGNQGGESETNIGRWLQARPGMRDKVKLFTKVGSDLGLPGHKGLKKAWVQQAVDDSLRRLNTDYIDLYMIHWPDGKTDIRKTMEVLAKEQLRGKIKHLGLCNTYPEDFERASEIGKIEVVQNQLNFFERESYQCMEEILKQHTISFMSWGTLDKGILSGRVQENRRYDKSDARSWAPWWKNSTEASGCTSAAIPPTPLFTAKKCCN